MIAAIIPARGGSKGVPGKNIKRIGGYPLIYWSIQAAKRAQLLDEFYVSTEDSAIAEVARRYGAKVIARPEELARDESTTLDVLRHAISGKSWDAVVVLQPTSPMRDLGTIDGCIRDYLDGGYDTLATGYECKLSAYATHNNVRRQDMKGFFYDDGNVYVIGCQVLRQGRWSGDKICRKPLERELNFEIDDETDFFIVDQLLRKRLSERKQAWDLGELLPAIKLLAMDVDGVLTDAGMYYAESADEFKRFNTRDGKGIELIRAKGIRTALITSEDTELVKRRAAKLKIDHLAQGASDKVAAMDRILSQSGLDYGQVAYIGDDVNDIDLMKKVALPITVRGGTRGNRDVALYETSAGGGEGAVREICDLLCGS